MCYAIPIQPHTQKETEWGAVELAIDALREKQEREENEPLTLEILCLPQLRQMEGERVMVMRMGVMTQAELAIVKKGWSLCQ